MTGKFLATYAAGVVKPAKVSPLDQRRIVNALRASAQQMTREANGRKHAGPAFKDVRAELRAEARELQRLATSLDY